MTPLRIIRGANEIIIKSFASEALPECHNQFRKPTWLSSKSHLASRVVPFFIRYEDKMLQPNCSLVNSIQQRSDGLVIL